MAIVERFKQESMYGLSAKKSGCCGDVAVSGGLIAGSRGGTRGGGLPLFLDQNEARRAEKNFFEACPHPLSQGLDDRASPYVKVWIRHWTVIGLKERERERAHASQISRGY